MDVAMSRFRVLQPHLEQNNPFGLWQRKLGLRFERCSAGWPSTGRLNWRHWYARPEETVVVGESYRQGSKPLLRVWR